MAATNHRCKTYLQQLSTLCRGLRALFCAYDAPCHLEGALALDVLFDHAIRVVMAGSTHECAVRDALHGTPTAQ